MARFLVHIPAVLYVTVEAPDANAAAACGKRLAEDYNSDAHLLGRTLDDPTPSDDVRVRDDARFMTLGGAPDSDTDVDVVPIG